MQGSIDGTPEYIEHVKKSYAHTKRFYEADGVPENLVLRIHNCGHHFLDEFKWEAFTRLRQYFGMEEKRVAVPLTQVLTGARQCFAADNLTFPLALFDLETFPDVQISNRTRVIADDTRLIDAYRALFNFFIRKASGASLDMVLKEGQNTLSTTFRILSNAPQETADTRVSAENYLRHAQQLFVGTGASLKQKVATDALEYTVTMPKA